MTVSRKPDLGEALQRAGYAAAQSARVAWYAGHYIAGRALFGAIGAGRDASFRSSFDRRYLGRRFREVFDADRRSLAAGEYRLPASVSSPPDVGRAFASSFDYLQDARLVADRRRRHGHSEVLSEAAREKYPRYFLQNFHYQSDGWLSAESAARYDTQVETLFTGAADAMRRRALPALRRAMNGRDPAALRAIDLGCGTGRFLETVKATWPALSLTALDLSPAYLGEARARLGGAPGVAFRQAPAEATGYDDATFDAISSVYLFHELPPAARTAVASEICRLLKPGGVYIHADTLQYGDDAPLDALLQAFPHAVHEPYYDSYCRLDLAGLFAAAGLVEAGAGEQAFLTRIRIFRKPD